MLATLLGAISRLALRKVLLLKSPAVIATILALVLASGTAHAQQGPGGEPGPGGASSPMMKGANNTAGWNLMSAEEQRAHQAKMSSMTTYAECKEYMEKHDQELADRAKAKGMVLRSPNERACDQMKMMGRLK